MNKVFSLLDRIEQSYGVYIGDKSISKLALFVSGFECALYETTGVRTGFNYKFQKFVERYYGKAYYNGKHWDDIILEKCSSPDAFDAFFVLLREFQKEEGLKTENE